MRSNRLKPSKILSERELCRVFLEHVGSLGGWTAYPETAGFDILLSRHSDGQQIGIEAKLTLSSKALSQVLPARYEALGKTGSPDYRAVLVPARTVRYDLLEVCAALGVTVIQLAVHPSGAAPTLDPDLPRTGDELRSSCTVRHWHDWAPERRVELPEYVPDSAAGSPSPIQLTPWKILAIKLAILLEERNVTPADFRALGMSSANWLRPESPWLVRVERGVFGRGPAMPNFRAMHPRNYEEIRADRVRWNARLEAAKKKEK